MESNQMFAQIPEAIQTTIATSAGIVLKDFNPTAVGEATAIRQNILFATSGGVNASCVAEMKDDGEDIDNCPKNTKELARILRWICKLSGTALTVTKDTSISLLGAADTTGSDVVEVTPRVNLKDTDFKTLWYVCPYGTEGGFVAVKLENALSTGGFSMQSEDNGKGKFAFDYTGYSSVTNQNEVPFKFYLKAKGSLPAMEMKVGL